MWIRFQQRVLSTRETGKHYYIIRNGEISPTCNERRGDSSVLDKIAPLFFRVDVADHIKKAGGVLKEFLHPAIGLADEIIGVISAYCVAHLLILNIFWGHLFFRCSEMPQKMESSFCVIVVFFLMRLRGCSRWPPCLADMCQRQCQLNNDCHRFLSGAPA
jgi:hypothetical protein